MNFRTPKPAEKRCIFFRKVIGSRVKGIRLLEQRARGGPCNVDTFGNNSGDFSYPQRNRAGFRSTGGGDYQTGHTA